LDFYSRAVKVDIFKQFKIIYLLLFRYPLYLASYMKIHLSPAASNMKEQVTYLFKLLGINRHMSFEVLISDDRSAPTVGISSDNTFQLSDNFINKSLSVDHLNHECLFQSKNGSPDYISSAFFFVSSLQEYKDKDPDPVGRFQYKNSYQFKLNNVKENLVQRCFDNIASSLQLGPYSQKSSFFLSHDIDSVYGSIVEDGFNVLKHGRLDKFFALLFNVAMSKPDWLNMDRIMKIENEYDCRSTFFWIMNKGGEKGLKNADYNFHSPAIQRHFASTEKNGFENGLHKSLSDESFADELKKYGSMPLGNRYHYLKFKLPQGYDSIEQSGLKLDASLGFSEQMGFRNSYGLPFNPFDFQNNKPYSFVEVPLHVMDRTFFHKRMDVKSVEKEILDFFDQNKTNCVLSVLWHNNFFTDFKFKGYLSLYKTILQYIKEGDFASLSQQEIINKYRISWP
jgi:hypothetical protein